MQIRRMIFGIITLLISLNATYAQKDTIAYGSNPNAGHYASVNGIKIYYESYGKGEPLIMLHGNGGSIHAFSHQIPFFKKHFRVIAIDSRLQGKSGGSPDSISYDLMASDFCALLDYLHISSANVLGWSDGGNEGLIMAMKCPQKVKRLAISGANVVSDSTAISNADIMGMKDFVMNPKTASKTQIALTKMMIDQPNIPYVELASILCPVLVMAGDHDIIKPEHTLRIFQSIPNASLCIFPDSNHGVCQQHPELFNKTVFTFFKK